MGRRARQEQTASLSAEAAALDPVRRRWYRRHIAEGDPPAEALRKAKEYTPARERMRAVDPEGGATRRFRADD